MLRRLPLLSLLATIAFPVSAAAQSVPPGTPTNVPPPLPTTWAAEERATEDAARADALRRRPQLAQEAAARVDAERRAAWEARGPVVHIPTYEAPRDPAFLRVATGLRSGMSGRGQAAVLTDVTFGWPLGEHLAVRGLGGLVHRSVEAPTGGTLRSLRPLLGAGVDAVWADGESRTTLGLALDVEVAVGAGRASYQPTTIVTPYARFATDACVFRYTVTTSGHACLGLGGAIDLGVRIPGRATGVVVDGSDKTRMILNVSFGPSVQF